jgi:tRNA-dihydrouridine synthase
VEDISRFSEQYPQVEAVMIGRGLIGDPGMLSPGGTDLRTLEAFYDELLEHYIEAFGTPRNAMFRMKENWRYLLCRFDGAEKLGKKLRKTTDVKEFRSITSQIFHALPLKETLDPDW